MKSSLQSKYYEHEPYRMVYKTSLSEFIRKTFTLVSGTAQYHHNWHIDCIAEYLTACRNGDIKRLIINIPPRFLKSISASVAFPAWLLGHNPSEQILCASYAKDLATKLGTDCRALMETDWYKWLFPEVQFASDQNTKTKFKTTKNGHRIAVGAGGTITGEGGNYIIIDDPIKPNESNSRVTREHINNWFGQTAYTRLNDKKNGVIIIIMQRLHQNDLTGFLLEQGGWEHLKIPLIAEEDKIYKIGSFYKEVKEGDLLAPEQMDKQEVEDTKRALRAYNFSGQYQQNPTPSGGGEFKEEDIQYYRGKLDARDMSTYIMVDPANAKKKNSDYTAMAVIGLSADQNLYVLDIVRDKLNLRERQEMLFKLHSKYKPKQVLYERYGKDADIDALKEAMEYYNYRFSITEIGGKLDKEDRIRRLIPYFNDQRVYFPERLFKTDYEGITRDLVEEVIHEELLPFPVGKHDDFIDALSRILDSSMIWPGGHGDFNYHEFYK